MTYRPPFEITPLIFKISQDVSKVLGLLAGIKIDITPIKLRRINSIKTIQASLAIEGNTLHIDQVTDIFNGTRVVGPERDILEVSNAIAVYKNLSNFNPLSVDDLLRSHKIMMKDLVQDNGQWRRAGVGIFKGNEITHLAPPAKRVSVLMENLFAFLVGETDTPWLIKSCIFHYELEFIHPFSDGNGRIGRLWQQLILMKEDPLFEFIPLEVLIKENQQEYYRVLGECDKRGNVTLFIEFALTQILSALKIYNNSTKTIVDDFEARLFFYSDKTKQQWFSRKDYLDIHKNISTATASRDLAQGVVKGILQKRGQHNQVSYCFIV